MLLYPSVEMNSDSINVEEQQVIKKDVVLSLEFTQRVLAAYAGKQDISQPLLSPVNGNLEILPPVLLQHGTDDILIRGTRKLVDKMEKAGKAIQFEEFTGMLHGFILIPRLPEANLAIRSQVKFIKG